MIYLCLYLAKFNKYRILLFNLVKNGGPLIHENSKMAVFFTTKRGFDLYSRSTYKYMVKYDNFASCDSPI